MSTLSQNFYRPHTPTLLSSVEASEKGMLATFTDGDKKCYPWFWLRDHSIDAGSLDQTTLQRKVDTFKLDPDIVCTNFSVDLDEQLIELSWSDGVSSNISAYMLASVVDKTPSRHQLTPNEERVLWDRDRPLKQLPTVSHTDVMTSNEGLYQWLRNIHIFGFCLVEGVPATAEATTEMAKRVGIVQETIFGTMWPLSSELVDHGDTAYTTSYLEPHTDGTYYHEAPGLQMFNCLAFEGRGGESIQVDAFAIAEQIKAEDPDAYATLCEISVPCHYIEPGVHLRAQRPPFRLDNDGNLIQVSFNNYDRAPFLLSTDDSRCFHHAYGLFHKHAIDQDNWLKIPLTSGKTLIFDNWRNLHGRMAYLGKREFYGCYHSRAEFESKLRVLRATLESND